MNVVKTGVLLMLLTVLFVFVGSLIGDRSGAVVALLLAVAMNFSALFFGDRVILAMYRARELSRHEAPVLFRSIEQLCGKVGLPMPRVYLIPTEAPNAFATGRDPAHASVAVTQGILRILSPEELSGVLAHELAHVRNRDMLVMTVAATVAGAITFLARMVMWFGSGRENRRENQIGAIGLLLFIVLAPIAAMLIQLAISRSREYLADDTGARTVGSGLPLASALRKLAAGNRAAPMQEGDPATSSLFIVNPFTAGGLAGLFSTHPPIEERIRRLEAMAV